MIDILSKLSKCDRDTSEQIFVGKMAPTDFAFRTAQIFGFVKKHRICEAQ